MTAVLSPCIRNCCLNQENICLGCFRSLPEITGWRDATDQQRLQILKAAEKRGREHRQNIQISIKLHGQTCGDCSTLTEE